MKSIILLLVIFSFSKLIIAQAKKDIITVLPSDEWCIKHNYMIEYKSQGKSIKKPDYKKAFKENINLKFINSTLLQSASNRGFSLLDAQLNIIEPKENEGIKLYTDTSYFDIKKTADIIFYVSFETKGNDLSFELKAVKSGWYNTLAVTNKTYKIKNTDLSKADFSELIRPSMDIFFSSLMDYFEDMFANGREIKLTIKRVNTSKINFNTVIKSKELKDLFNDYLLANSIKSKYEIVEMNDFEIKYKVRMALYDKKGIAISAKDFAEDMRKYFEGSPFKLSFKLSSLLLYDTTLILN